MHLERLEINNFASYYGEHHIDLHCSEECPVVIVVGGTGYGKSSLFDAINWALYGTDYEPDLIKRRKRKIIDYLNESALRDAASRGGQMEMSCTLYFEHDGIHYYIMQALAARAVVSSNGRISAQQTDRSTDLYEIRPDGDHRPLEYNTIFLDEILPSNVRDYFLFDGDRIHNLSNPGASQEVRDAIYRVVDLELIQNAKNHLLQIAKEYQREAKRESSGLLEDVESRYEIATEDLEKLKDERKNLEKEIEAISTQIKKLETRLQDLPDTSALQERRENFERQLSQANQRYDAAVIRIRELSSMAVLSIAATPVLELTKALDAKRTTGEIPKQISQRLLRDILKVERCICGTDLNENPRALEIITQRLNEEMNKASGQELLELFYKLGSASSIVSTSLEEVRTKDRELDDLHEQRRELDLAIKQVDAELELLPKDDIRELTRQLKERRDSLLSTDRKIQHLRRRISDKETEIDNLDKQRKELAQKQKKVKRAQTRERIARQSAEQLESIYEEFAEDSRRAIEELTKQEFQQFVKSASSYHVALTEDYELQVLDSHGNIALQRLSMGQSQCLSLAFITAISRVSEKNPPLVIDMPFGRLDQRVHQEVSDRLPQLTNQLILFLIPDVEWNDTTMSNLYDKASHVYELDFDEGQRETHIIRVD